MEMTLSLVHVVHHLIVIFVDISRSICNELYDMFLPVGYPESVSEEYLTFQLWDTCQVRDDLSVNIARF
jgi:hypothetical protein